jgi:competence protein ComFC
LPFCLICKSNRIEKGSCLECLKREPLFKTLVAIGVYSGLLKGLIYNFKYEGQKNYMEPFALVLSEKIRRDINLAEINFITCIPLHEDKLKQRGFNQSELIARNIGKQIKKPYLNIFTRVKNTKPQFSLNHSERTENLEGAFLFTAKKNLQGESLLIVDDIYTTGATLHEACKVLTEQKVKSIYIAVLARALSG